QEVVADQGDAERTVGGQGHGELLRQGTADQGSCGLRDQGHRVAASGSKSTGSCSGAVTVEVSWIDPSAAVASSRLIMMSSTWAARSTVSRWLGPCRSARAIPRVPRHRPPTGPSGSCVELDAAPRLALLVGPENWFGAGRASVPSEPVSSSTW